MDDATQLLISGPIKLLKWIVSESRFPVPANNPFYSPTLILSTLLPVIALLGGCTGFHNAWYMHSATFRTTAVYSPVTASNGISARYVQLANKAGHFYDVPPALILAVCDEESRFNSKAVSSTGAEGLMQLMPDTAAQMGVSRPFNARQAIWGGTRYLSLLLHHYGGNIRLALAAYHSGTKTVAYTHGRVPVQSQSYVANVLAKYRYFSRFQTPGERAKAHETDANR